MSQFSTAEYRKRNSILLTSPALLTSLLAWKTVEFTCSISCDYCKCVYTKHNTEYTYLFALMLFVFPCLAYVLTWCSIAVNLLVVTLHKKLSSVSRKVTFNRKSVYWRYTHVVTSGGGKHFIASAPGAPETLVTPLWQWTFTNCFHTFLSVSLSPF